MTSNSKRFRQRERKRKRKEQVVPDLLLYDEAIYLRMTELACVPFLAKDRETPYTPEERLLSTVSRATISFASNQKFVDANETEYRTSLKPYLGEWIYIRATVANFRWYTKIDGRKTFRVLLVDPKGFSHTTTPEVIDNTTQLEYDIISEFSDETDPFASVQHAWLELFQSRVVSPLVESKIQRLQPGDCIKAFVKINEYEPGRFGIEQAIITDIGLPVMEPLRPYDEMDDTMSFDNYREVDFISNIDYPNFNIHGAAWNSNANGWKINLNRSDLSQQIHDRPAGGEVKGLKIFVDDVPDGIDQYEYELWRINLLSLLLAYDKVLIEMALSSKVRNTSPASSEAKLRHRLHVLKTKGLSAVAPADRCETKPNLFAYRGWIVHFLSVVDELPHDGDVEWMPIDHSRGIDFRGDFWTRVNYQLKKKIISRIKRREGNDLYDHARLGLTRCAQLLNEVQPDTATVLDLDKVMNDRLYANKLLEQLDGSRPFHDELKRYFHDENRHGYHDSHVDKYGNFYPKTTRFNRCRIARGAVKAFLADYQAQYSFNETK